MKEGKASFSAEVIAAMRALESRRPEHLRICYDPYARHLISSRFRFLAQTRLGLRLINWFLEKRGPGLAAGIAARTRYIDDIINLDISAGAKQLVILGAGLDMRTYRLDSIKDVSVFEVDFPATQALKRAKTAKLNLPEGRKLTYVPIDFNHQKLKDVLYSHGYDPLKRTVFIWEGVTMYLKAEAVSATLNFIRSNSGQESTLVFDYLFQSVLDGRNTLPEAKHVQTTKSFAGRGTEFYTFGIEEAEIETFLEKHGFKLLEHMDADKLKERYFHGANANRYIFKICGFVHAQVN